jgi:hypothetical protein
MLPHSVSLQPNVVVRFFECGNYGSPDWATLLDGLKTIFATLMLR